MSMNLPHAIEAFSKTSPEATPSKAGSNITTAQTLNKESTENSKPLTENTRFVTLSEQGKQLSKQSDAEHQIVNRASDTTLKPKSQLVYQKTAQHQLISNPIDGQHLTQEEQKEIDALKKRDQEVKNHERAHASIGGRFAGQPHYQYEMGPNGNRYAIDGEVSIDLTEIANNPQATIDKMKQVYRAALAPQEPSTEDRSIASEAQQTINSARSELAEENIESNSQTHKTDDMTPQHQQNKQNLNIYKQENNSKSSFHQLA